VCHLPGGDSDRVSRAPRDAAPRNILPSMGLRSLDLSPVWDLKGQSGKLRRPGRSTGAQPSEEWARLVTVNVGEPYHSFPRGQRSQRRWIVSGSAAIDLKAEFEVEREGGQIGGANLEESDLGAALTGGGQSVAEKAGGDTLLSPKGIGRQVVDVQLIENERGGEEANHPETGEPVEGDQGHKVGIAEKVVVGVDPTGAQSAAEFERHRQGYEVGGEGRDAQPGSRRRGTGRILGRHVLFCVRIGDSGLLPCGWSRAGMSVAHSCCGRHWSSASEGRM